MSKGTSSQWASTVSMEAGSSTGSKPLGSALPETMSKMACCCTPKSMRMASALGSSSERTVGLCIRRHTTTGLSPMAFRAFKTRSRSPSLAQAPTFPR